MDSKLLSLCTEIRDAIDRIHELAATVEAELGRFQIYAEDEAVPRALGGLNTIGEKVALIESRFRLVANATMHADDEAALGQPRLNSPGEAKLAHAGQPLAAIAP
jgi:hypothetical protein